MYTNTVPCDSIQVHGDQNCVKVLEISGGSQDGASRAWISDGCHGHMVSRSPRVASAPLVPGSACWTPGWGALGIWFFELLLN